MIQMNKIFIILLLSSCAYLVDKIDRPIFEEYSKTDEKEVLNFCPINQKVDFQLVGSNEHSQQVYMELVKKYPQFDFIDHFALWNLLQLSIRPDQSSPTSRFQVLIHIGSKSYYLDFYSESTEDQFPLIYGIDWVLKKFGKKKSLEQYAKVINQQAEKLKIGKDFETFLVKNYSKIKLNPELAPYFLRGADILKENETAPYLNYQKVIQIYREAEKKQKIILNTSLTPFLKNDDVSGSCNYDFSLYDNSIFLIDNFIPEANLYGLAFKDSAFFSSSSQRLKKIASFRKLPLFEGESKVRSSAVCMIESKSNLIWTFSNQSRDPGQHLFHLMRYGLTKSPTPAEVNKFIRHSRHLFLSDPTRLIIESKRSSQEQIEQLLKFRIPIYNAEKLGNIWAYTLFNDVQRFIIDDRNPGAFNCK